MLTFFFELFDIKKTKLIEEYHYKTVSHDAKNDTKIDQFPGKYSKIESLFQIMYNDLHNSYKKMPLHIMNACKTYEKCKSKELIMLFNQSGLCISYHSMKRHKTDLAKYVIKQTNDTEITIPLPSHFSASSFTLSAFDNFGHNDNSSLSGKKSTHDTMITLFQVKPSTPANKPLKSEVNLLCINSFLPLPCQIIWK